MIEPAFIEGYMLLPSALILTVFPSERSMNPISMRTVLESLSLVIPEDVFYHAPVGSE